MKDPFIKWNMVCMIDVEKERKLFFFLQKYSWFKVLELAHVLLQGTVVSPRVVSALLLRRATFSHAQLRKMKVTLQMKTKSVSYFLLWDREDMVI